MKTPKSGNIVIPAGCAFYVTQRCDAEHSLIGNIVESHPDLPLDRPVTNRCTGIYFSRYEVRYPRDMEVVPEWLDSSERGTVRVFRLPDNSVGKYLVVILSDKGAGWPKPYDE